MFKRLRGWFDASTGRVWLCPLGWHYWHPALSWECDDGYARHCPDCDAYEAKR